MVLKQHFLYWSNKFEQTVTKNPLLTSIYFNIYLQVYVC